jgi:uncharacterized protein (TIGR03435 family)
MGAQLAFTTDGFTAVSVPLQMVIMYAYNLRNNPSLSIGGGLIAGAPGWILSDHYDIQAKISESDVAVLQKLDRKPRSNQERLMLQELLRDRFNLKLHFEGKETSAYSLVVMKNGPKNLKSEPDSALAGFDRTRDHLSFLASAISELVEILTQEMMRPVLDETNLKGKYDFSLAWSLDAERNAARGETGSREADASRADSSGPSIVTALQEQLGMKLLATKTSVESPIIDSVERPSPN